MPTRPRPQIPSREQQLNSPEQLREPMEYGMMISGTAISLPPAATAPGPQVITVRDARRHVDMGMLIFS